MKGNPVFLKVIASTLLGAAIGAWSQYPDEQNPPGSLIWLGVIFGGLLGLLMGLHFAPVLSGRRFAWAVCTTVSVSLILGLALDIERRFVRGELVAWSATITFAAICLVASRNHKGA